MWDAIATTTDVQSRNARSLNGWPLPWEVPIDDFLSGSATVTVVLRYRNHRRRNEHHTHRRATP